MSHNELKPRSSEQKRIEPWLPYRRMNLPHEYRILQYNGCRSRSLISLQNRIL
jgi:hypothetical protein